MDKKEFTKFFFAGGLAAIVNIASRALLDRFLGYGLSIVIACLIGMTTAFILSRRYVFAKSGRPAQSDYMRFVLVNIIAVLQIWTVSMGLARYIFPAIGFTLHPELVAHAIGVIVPVFSSYYGHKLFTFRSEV